MPHLGSRCWGQDPDMTDMDLLPRNRRSWGSEGHPRYGGGLPIPIPIPMEGYYRVVLNLQDGRQASKGGPQLKAFNVEDNSNRTWEVLSSFQDHQKGKPLPRGIGGGYVNPIRGEARKIRREKNG